MTDVRVVFTKDDGRRHWHATLRRLGEDEHGIWLGASAGVVWQRGDERPIVFTYAHVSLFPRDAWWVANFNTEPSDVDIYCDVTDVPVWTGPDEVRMADLDLDVIRVRSTGEVKLVDEDEFASHQMLYKYPEDVVRQAQEAADWLTGAVPSREPFTGAYRHWLSMVDG